MMQRGPFQTVFRYSAPADRLQTSGSDRRYPRLRTTRTVDCVDWRMKT